MDRIRIDSLDELKRLSNGISLECYLGVSVISRKTITYHEKEKEFVIENHIDDTQTCVLAEDIYDTRITNVGEAILNNCLFYEIDDNLDNPVLFPEEGDISQSVFANEHPTLEEQEEYDRMLADQIQRQMEEEANEGPLPQDNYNYNPEP